MKKKILALILALTMCFGTTMTANAAMIVKNDMSALGTSNILDKNSSQIPKGTLQYLASKFKIVYTQEDLDALKKIFDANLYAKAYPDVAAAYGNDREALWNHYVTHGIKEGRTQINSTFNVFAYIAAYPDLRNAFGDDLMAYYVHYANYGMNENRKLITVDAVTKAGYTITGINGQVIAVPKLEPAPSTVESVTEPDPAPVEETAPTQTPSPSVTPTPTPEEPLEPAACNHSYTIGEPIQSSLHMHYVKCEYCGEYATREDGSKLPIECYYVNSVCRECGRECEHNFDGMQQIGGTITHGLLCTICGYVDTENAQECKADHCDSVNDLVHKEICRECGGVIKEEPHQYAYERGTGKAGEPIHKGRCSTCQNEMERPCVFDEGSNECTVCHNQHTEHQWDSNDGHCKFCGVTCSHPSWNSEQKCVECGKECEHEWKAPGICKICNKQCDHSNGISGICFTCGLGESFT